MRLLYKIVLSLLMVVIMNSQCDTTALHDLNFNPNAVNKIDVNYFFTSVELGSASNISGVNLNSDWVANVGICAHTIQQLSYASNSGNGAAGDKYLEKQVPTFAGDLFDAFYTDVAQNCAEILRQTGPGGLEDGKKINMRSATRILRVLCFHRLTDWYGNIPYFNANKGIEGISYVGYNNLLTPIYDKQKDIYADLLKELDEATSALSTSNPDEGFASADFIYKGDAEKWKRFGYSLMLRLAMRISNVDVNSAGIYVTKAVAGGVFESNNDNAWVKMANGPLGLDQNGISTTFDPGYLNQNSFLSKTLIDMLMGPDKTSTTDDDPRLMIYSGGVAEWTPGSFTLYPDGTDPLNQKGMPNGKDQNMLDELEGHQVDQASTYSRINPKMLQLDAPYPLMNYAEPQFLMAEALERGIGSGITGSAKSHYEEGVKAACQMWTFYDPSLTVSDSAVAAYLAIYPYGVAKSGREMVYDQLWLSKWMNWWEAWSDWRRTDSPKLIPVNYPGNDTNGQIPRKLLIPPDEMSNNHNYATGATQPNDFTGKVWWDGGHE